MFLDNKKIHKLNLGQLVYNPKLPKPNINIETLVKLSHTNIPNDLPLISTTYTKNPKLEENIIILLSNLLLKIRKIQGHTYAAVAFYHELDSQELLFLYTTYKKYNLINHLEDAIILHQLNKEGFTHTQIANVLGVSRSYVTNKVRLVHQPKVLIQALLDGEISEGHAKIIMGLKDKTTKLNILDIVRNENLSVKQTVKLVQNFKGVKPHNKKLPQDVQEKLSKIQAWAKRKKLQLSIFVPKRRRKYIAKFTFTIDNKNQLDNIASGLKE